MVNQPKMQTGQTVVSMDSLETMLGLTTVNIYQI